MSWKPCCKNTPEEENWVCFKVFVWTTLVFNEKKYLLLYIVIKINK